MRFDFFCATAEILTSSKTTNFHPARRYNSQVLKYDGRAGLSVLVSDILSHESLPSCERESSVKMLKGIIMSISDVLAVITHIRLPVASDRFLQVGNSLKSGL